MNDDAVFLLVLVACVCGALIAVGLLGHLLWLREQQEREARMTQEQTVFVSILGACVLGALLAVGVLEYAVWLEKQEEGGRG